MRAFFPSTPRNLRAVALAATLAATVTATVASPAPASGPTASAPAAPAAEIAWREVAGEGDVDQAFAAARAARQPVLLYWGARWCPPCNRLKATLFNRQDFIERTRAVVAVHLDGDVPAAQKLGARFKVRGYPTLILFQPDGTEITRLPGEAEPGQVLRVLQMGLSSGRPIRAVLDDARAGRPLTGSEWRLLAFYSWDTDEEALAPEAGRSALLARLAAACPAAEGEAATRLLLKSLAATEPGQAPPATASAAPAAVRQRVLALLADPVASREHLDVLAESGTDVVKALAPKPGADRRSLAAALDRSLQRLQADATLSRADRLSALSARVDLALVDQPDAKHPRLPAPLLADVKAMAHEADARITDGYERQAVIPEVASLMTEAGLVRESDALLQANLAKSHSPYYLMSELARNAQQEGRTADALRWYAQAFDRSDGPATRLQWGASYVAALVQLAPQDAARIEQVAGTLFDEAARQPGAFHDRSGRALRKVGDQLLKWNAGGRHAASLERLQSRLDGACAALPAGDPQKATCSTLLRPAAGKA